MSEGTPPSVTVIVATYQRGALLGPTLRAIARQGHRDLEVLVVGDACTDDTAAVVAGLGDPRFTFTNLPRNTGTQAGPNNEGLARARGSWIAYCGHDDLWLPHHLATLLAAARREGADLVHSLCALLGPDHVLAVGPPRTGVPYTRHWNPPSSWLHRRELAAAVGGWPLPDRAFPDPVDLAFLSAAARHGAVAFAPRLTVLKYPSAWWRAYDRGAEAPQPACEHAMIADAGALEHETLTQVAVHAAARAYGGREPVPHLLAEAVRALGWTLVDAWGRRRWPVAPLLNAWTRRRRARRDASRGLSRRDGGAQSST